MKITMNSPKIIAIVLSVAALGATPAVASAEAAAADREAHDGIIRGG